ncbi:MAG: hypothetical protein HY674_19070 [Chloroflexi bacterium]|nr:hypothetical protein [Chloroflexota bacterium]
MIAVEQVARLAGLYDRYNNALDPLSEDAVQARRQFDDRVSNLHSAHAPDVNFFDFRYEVVRRCREYLQKN